MRRLLLPVITIIFLGYFAYHAFQGENGIVGRARLENRAQQLNHELEQLIAQHKDLDARVRLLRPATLDQDMVDEEARAQLSMVHPSEVVIMRAQNVALQDNLDSVQSTQ
jgi:cell division protein FtsB